MSLLILVARDSIRGTPREPEQKHDGGEPAGEGEEPGRPVPRGPQSEIRGDERQMARSELVRLGEPAPRMGCSEPTLGKLDADGRVAVVLDAEKERGKAGGEAGEERDELEPALLHFRAFNTTGPLGQARPVRKWRSGPVGAIHNRTGWTRARRKGPCQRPDGCPV